MTIRIGDWQFDDIDYDAEADVLYMSMGKPRPGYGEETPEGHILRFDEAGEFCGLTLIGVRQLMDSNGELTVSVPATQSAMVDRPALRRALAFA